MRKKLTTNSKEKKTFCEKHVYKLTILPVYTKNIHTLVSKLHTMFKILN